MLVSLEWCRFRENQWFSTVALLPSIEFMLAKTLITYFQQCSFNFFFIHFLSIWFFYLFMFQAEREEKKWFNHNAVRSVQRYCFFCFETSIHTRCCSNLWLWLYIQAEWLNFSLNIMRIIAIFIGCMHTLKAIIKARLISRI